MKSQYSGDNEEHFKFLQQSHLALVAWHSAGNARGASALMATSSNNNKQGVTG